jgi:signal transduction histidine kinase
MKVSTRFSLAAIFVAVFTLVEASIFFYAFQKAYFKKVMSANQQDTVEKFVRVCQESVWTKNDFLLVNYMKEIAKTPAVRYALFLDPHGQILMTSDVTNGIKAIGKSVTDPFLLKLVSSEEPASQELWLPGDSGLSRYMSSPVFMGDTKVGTALIVYDQNAVTRRITESLNQALHQFAKFAILGLIMAILAAFVLARNITRPVQELARGAQTLAQGKLDYQIEMSRSDELGALAQEFNRMARRLKQLDQMKDDFVSSVSHELRAPMTAIKGYVDLLLKNIHGPLLPKQIEDLQIVKSNTERLGSFINNVLDMAKLEAGLMQFDPQPVDVEEIANDIATLFKPTCETHSIKLIMDISDNLPAAYTDPERLRQVFTNLLNNAIKFTPDKGTITLWAKYEKTELLMGVTDNGVGIPADKIHTVFDKFSQVKETQNKARVAKGTGLGLPITKNIVEAQGGRIWVESTLGKGTSFLFTCSAVPKNNEAAPPVNFAKFA